MRLKFDDTGHVVVEDGKPVYILGDESELAFDAGAAVARAEKAEPAPAPPRPSPDPALWPTD
jgi:hypothetical protein